MYIIKNENCLSYTIKKNRHHLSILIRQDVKVQEPVCSLCVHLPSVFTNGFLMATLNFKINNVINLFAI